MALAQALNVSVMCAIAQEPPPRCKPNVFDNALFYNYNNRIIKPS